LVGFLFFLLAQFSAFWLRSAMKTPSGRHLALFAFFFAANVAQAAPGAVDFSSYDVPLYEQIVNRIKAKVSARWARPGARAIAISSFLLLTKTAGTTRNIRTRLSQSSECWRTISNPN
jgi:hypothetical protein